MEATTGRRAWPRATVALLFSLALAWGLLRFGAAETGSLYRLFLFLSVPAVIAALTLPLGRLVELRLLPLTLVGLFILGQVALRPTLEARGWIHLAVGWLALYLVLWVTAGSRRLTRFLVLVLILLGGLEAIYGLVQSVGGIDYIGGYFRNQGRLATGTFINRNDFAFALNLTLPLALGALYAAYERRHTGGRERSESWALTWMVLLACSFMGLAILLSQSRGGTLVLLATLLFVALLLTLNRRSARRGLSGAVAWILLFTVLGLGAALGLEALAERFGQLEEGDSRITVYRDTLELVADHPLLGVGPGMYRWRFRPYQTSNPELRWEHAHNDYLESAAEWGLPLALLAWGFVFWRLLQTSRRFLESHHPDRQGLALGCAAAIFSVLLHSLVDFGLQLPALLMMFGAVLALAWNLDLEKVSLRVVKPEENSGTDGPAGLALRGLLVLLVVGAGWQVLPRARAVEAARPENGLAGLERAVDLDAKAPEHHFLLGLVRRDLPGSGDPTTAAEQLSKAVQLNPYHWGYHLELARTWELLGRLDDAESALVAAVELNPNSGRYRWRLANFHLRRGEIDKAVEEIGRAVALDPTLQEPALALLIKTGADLDQIEALWPDDRTGRLWLLRTLLSQRIAGTPEPSLDLLERLWERLLEDPEVLSLAHGGVYLKHLLERGEVEKARSAWVELAHRNDLEDPAFEQQLNLVWNGDFEQPLAGRPLGWQVRRSEAYTAKREPGEGLEGGTALGLDFNGTENVGFAGVVQRTVVRSEQDYILSFSMRTEGLSTDQGIFLEVVPVGGKQLVATEPVLQTGGWKTFTETFTVPENTELIELRLRRRPSRRLDNRLRGQIWLDRVTLEPTNP